MSLFDMDATSTEPSRVAIALVEAGIIKAEAAEHARLVVARTLGRGFEPEPSRGARIVEVVAYAGGALVFAAGGIFLSTKWFDLRQSEQVGALAVVAGVLAAAGLLVGLVEPGVQAMTSGSQDVRRRLAGALFSGSAIAIGFLVGEWVDLHATHDLPVIAGSLAAVLAGILAYWLAPTAVGQLVVASGAWIAVAASFAQAHHADSLWVGVAQLALAVAWLLVAEREVLREQVVGRAIGCLWALTGAQWVALDADVHSLGYVITAAVGLAALAAYTVKLSWPYVALGVLAVTVVVPEAVLDWSNSSLGAAVGVLLAGIALLATSFAGYRIHSEALT